MKTRTVILPIITLFICVGIFYKWTLGFKAFTVFSHTMETASPLDKEFPEIMLINHDSTVIDLKELPKYKLANFVYLNCPFVCHKVNNQLERIYHSIDSTLIPNKIEFVTISFDLEKDNVHRIRNYREHFEDIPGWSFAIPHQMEQQEFDSFLKNIGVWIYKEAANGIINHSTDLYLISPENKIVKTFDPNRLDNRTIIQEINQWINKAEYIVSR